MQARCALAVLTALSFSPAAAAQAADNRPVMRRVVRIVPVPTEGPVTVATWLSVGAVVGGVGMAVGSLAVRHFQVESWNDPSCLAGGRARWQNCAVYGGAAETAERLAVAGLIVGGVGLLVGGAMSIVRWPFVNGRLRVAGGPGDVGLGLEASF